jgi:predicted unusual protein kinase regulating ubiquinone biosynthesis (AarF/ABC1/UbiB family)
VHGFFHADPHPGNLRVMPREGGNRAGGFRLTLFDFGLARPLPSGFRQVLRDVVAALLRGDRSALRSGLFDLGLRDRQGGVDDLEPLIEKLAPWARLLDLQVCRAPR